MMNGIQQVETEERLGLGDIALVLDIVAVEKMLVAVEGIPVVIPVVIPEVSPEVIPVETWQVYAGVMLMKEAQIHR
jgi:hypothetical protein